MKVELICPADQRYRKMKARSVHNAALNVLASLTPRDVELKITEEQLGDEVTYDEDVDVAGITMFTTQAPRGYEIADEFRRRGKKVVLGGIHASVLPEEALSHADAVVVGEAELVWRQVLEDLAANRSRGIYRADRLADMETEVLPFRREVFTRPTSFSVASLQASRGCPYDCEFCSGNLFFGRRYRFRPVEAVVAEAEAAPSRFLFFIDDNIIASPTYARRLFEGLRPLGKKWIGQASLHLATKDPSLLKLAAKSGCSGLFVGLESISHASLTESNALAKNRTRTLADTERSLAMLHGEGILVMAAMVFGFDSDDKYIFQRTVRFLTRNRVAFASMAVLTPYPGTRLNQRLHAEGRILHQDWRRYNNDHAVFRPAQMTPDELRSGCDWTCHEFFRWRNVMAKAWVNRQHPFLYLATSTGWHMAARKYREATAALMPRHELDRSIWCDSGELASALPSEAGCD